MKAPQECESIDEIRAAIDAIDAEVIAALGRRFAYVQEIMRFKRNEADVRAPDRYAAVLQQRRAWAQEAGLDPALIAAVYRMLIDHFIAHELSMLSAAGDARP